MVFVGLGVGRMVLVVARKKTPRGGEVDSSIDADLVEARSSERAPRR